MSLVKKIKNMCAERNTNLTELERELGFGRGALYKWDSSTPGIDKFKKVADYFGVSIDSLAREERSDGSSSK